MCFKSLIYTDMWNLNKIMKYMHNTDANRYQNFHFTLL